jgi:hypothetical protein
MLGILYWVYAGFVGLGGLMVALFAVLPVILVASAPPPSSGGPPPEAVMGVMAGIFGLAALFLIAKAVLMIFAGSALRHRRSYVLVMVGAAMAIMNIPLGTALAVYTFILLSKPDVKARFT